VGKARPSILTCLGCLVAASACQDSTGLHIVARVGDLQYDELRVGIMGGQVSVDPDTKGRYLGPFPPGDQDLYVYVADDAAGHRVMCSLSAMQGGAIVAQGRGETTIRRHVITDVEVVMDSADPNDPPPPPTGPPSKLANGQRCSTKAECISDQCADGVCCESDCAAACLSCAQPAMEGLCRPVPPGIPDPRGICKDEGAAKCKFTGLCDVSGHCANYPPGTICEAQACKDAKTLTQTAACDGAGHCERPPEMKCSTTCAAGVCL
jgi:hypothetical protein